jgi:hypothetical protein
MGKVKLPCDKTPTEFKGYFKGTMTGAKPDAHDSRNVDKISDTRSENQVPTQAKRSASHFDMFTVLPLSLQGVEYHLVCATT